MAQNLNELICPPTDTSIWQALLSDRHRVGKTSFDDSVFQFLQMARECPYYAPISDDRWGLPPSLPILFGLNPPPANQAGRLTSTSIISGNCLVGFEPFEDKLTALEVAASNGLALHDLLIYDHVNTCVRHLGNRAGKVRINLDTVYYRHKLRHLFSAQLSVDDVSRFVRLISSNQVRVIEAILPNADVACEDDDHYKRELDYIVGGGLLNFLVKDIRYFMGYDLGQERELALGVAYMAATYLYPTFALHEHALAIESALNVEGPARVVFPYLKKHHLEDHFSFVALVPLPDTKMSHGTMHYGNALQGKIFTDSSEDLVRHVVHHMSRNWEKAHRCWYVNYMLASRNGVPSVCRQTECAIHQEQLVEDILRRLREIPCYTIGRS